MMKKNLTLAVLVVAALALPNLSRSHEGSFKDADTIPPFGPHGGRTLKLTRHFAEVVVKKSTVDVYILERDVKTVASDASGVTLSAAIPGKNAKSIPLSKKGDGYTGAYIAPPSARRVIFTVNCVLDGKNETGTLQHEPRK
ncbi:MAG TPA: hypothetical protein VLM75_03310 [Spirochaetota bacterium]|nr:hypothetical protein [Spirochaetota bacterium]